MMTKDPCALVSVLGKSTFWNVMVDAVKL